MSPSSNKAVEATHSKMTKSNQPEKHTNADEAPAGKRQRRPSVRFGEIGGYVSSDTNRKATNKSQNTGKQTKNKDSKNLSAKNSEVYETLGGEKEGKLDRIETGKSKKSLVANTKRIRSNLMNVDDKDGKDGGDEFRVSDSESPIDSSENLEIEKQEKLKSTKRIRTDRVIVDKFSGGKNGDGDGNEGFTVSDSESPERENSEEDLEIENGDQVGNGNGNGNGNGRNGVRKGVRVLDEPSENGDEGEGNGVKGWLDQLGLGRYGPVFDVHEVDEEVLPLLTLEDLKDMGINAVGSRRKIYAYIQKLRE